MYVLDNVSRKPHRSDIFFFEIISTIYGVKFEESSEFRPLVAEKSDKLQNSLVCSPPLACRDAGDNVMKQTIIAKNMDLKLIKMDGRQN